MQVPHAEIIMCTSILYSLFSLALGDFEATCRAKNYTQFEQTRPGRLGVCVSHITDFISRNCRNGVDPAPAFSKASYQRGRNVFVDGSLASMVLRVRQQQDTYVGLDCECCLNRCSAAEFGQYCIMYTPRRRRRRDVTEKMKSNTQIDRVDNFKQEEIDQLYSEIEYDQTNNPDTLPQFPINRLDLIRQSKIHNIRKRLLSVLLGDSSELLNTRPYHTPTFLESKQHDNLVQSTPFKVIDEQPDKSASSHHSVVMKPSSRIAEHIAPPGEQTADYNKSKHSTRDEHSSQNQNTNIT